jgi:hypothetical protein
MKFYTFNQEKYTLNFIKANKLTAIYCDSFAVDFFKNGLRHNTKNAAYFDSHLYNKFFLNNICYGNEMKFNKYSWRRFVKLQVFL